MICGDRVHTSTALAKTPSEVLRVIASVRVSIINHEVPVLFQINQSRQEGNDGLVYHLPTVLVNLIRSAVCNVSFG